MLADYKDDTGKPTAGIRMDIPDFLASTFKILDNYGERMQRIHGRETRKYIKYDEPVYSLLPELKLPGGDSWLRLTPDLAGEFSSLSEIDRNRKKLTARRTIEPMQSANHIPIVRTDRLQPPTRSNANSDRPFNIHTTPTSTPNVRLLLASGDEAESHKAQTWKPQRR